MSSRGALARAEHLGHVRQGLSAEAQRLQGVRGEAHQTHQERLHHRVTDLIARELARDPIAPRVRPLETAAARGGEPPPVEPPDARAALPQTHREASPGPATASPSPGEARVQSTLELIEKIEVFVRAQRPALALRLGGALEATVEVERTGVREVALRVHGHRGPLRREDLTRIQEALAARGLKLSALSST